MMNNGTHRPRSTPLWFAFVVVLSGRAAEAAGPVTIVANPGRFGTIEQAAVAEKQVNWWDDDLADDNACTESFAAVELRRFFAACTGASEADIRLADPRSNPSGGDLILIGSPGTNAMIESSKPAGEKGFTPDAAEGFHILAAPAGDRTVTVIKGSDRVGALYGVYAYVEQLGVRFFGLGDRDTIVPGEPVDPPSKLDLAEKPDFLTRGFHAWEDRGDPDFFLWMTRNRLNLWCSISKDHLHLFKKLGMRLIAGGHDPQARCLDPNAEYPYRHARHPGGEGKPADPYAVSPDFAGDADKDGRLTYFEAHPEWYGLREGKRSNRIKGDFGDNYCTSNADATAELAKNLVRQCIDGHWRHVDLLNFWMLDVGKWCECEACAKQGTYTDRLLATMYAVRKAVVAARDEGRLQRNVQLVTLAYHETLPPPSRPLPADFDYANCFVTFFPIERCYVHALADPACTEINDALRADLSGWTTGGGRNYTGQIFIGEYYNVSSFKSLPLLFTRSMAADIPWYYRTGARHFHYMHVPTRLWGTWRLNQLLLARLLWNTRADADAVVADYFAAIYPTTADRMKAFYADLEYASLNAKAFKHYVRTTAGGYNLRAPLVNDKLPLFACDHLRYEPSPALANAGPSVVEMIEAMGRARRLIDDALLTCGDADEKARLVEDERRFAYGEATVEFYYRLVRTAMFHRQGDADQARREFAAAARQASVLKGIVDLVQVSSSHANATDGLDASQATAACERFRKLYGEAAATQAKE